MLIYPIPESNGWADNVCRVLADYCRPDIERRRKEITASIKSAIPTHRRKFKD
jgi:hypothetical protein